MDQFQLSDMMVWLPLIIILSVWEIIWKMIALWKSARNNHLAWFIIMAILNTVGNLPIIYILMYRNKTSAEATS